MNDNVIVGIDIGTTKICTVIGEIANDGVLDIIGEGTVPSDGMRKGVVTNLERTINSVRQSVKTAERMAGIGVEKAWVGVSGQHLKAITSHGISAIRRNQSINQTDINRTIEAAQAIPSDSNMEVIHVIPQEYVIDGNDGIKDPLGMSGVRLEVDVHIISNTHGELNNLRRCVSDAGIEVQGPIYQALASGLAVLLPEEKEETIILIDIGGGTTDLGVFRRGILAHSCVIPLGGDHITKDISQIAKIPFNEAERIKKKYAVAIPSLADREFSLEVSNPNYTTSISAFELAQIVNPRIVEILDLAKQEIEQSMGSLEVLASNVVLTGGSSLMSGMDQVTTERFRLPVRIANPYNVSGLKDIVSSPTHSTAVGLIRYGMDYIGSISEQPDKNQSTSGSSFFDSIKKVLGDFF